MSLITQPQPQKRRQIMETEEEEGPRKILNPATLIEIAKQVLGDLTVSSEEKREFKEHRKREVQASWRLETLLGRVTEENWVGMVQSQLKHMQNTFNISQSNGDWAVMEWEVDLLPGRTGEDRFFVGTRWVDCRGEKDLEYRDGIPSASIHVEPSLQLPPELAERMTSSSDNELKMLLKTLVTVMVAKETGTPIAAALASAGVDMDDSPEPVEEDPFNGE
jgi:hypothetical protein